MNTETHYEQENQEGSNVDVRVRQLLALNRAAITLTGELELEKLLQRIVDSARELVHCNYSALGVLGDDGYIARFPTSGISEVDKEKIGDPPRGHGLLGVMLRAGRTLRIPDIGKDPRRVGFPRHHPPMTSLLGVPIFVQGNLVGTLYLTNKIEGPEFSQEDEWLVQLLATHAATALTNSQLHAENMDALERVNRERARSMALFKVTQAINRSVHLDEVVQLILHSTVELLNAAAAAIYLLDAPNGDGSQETQPEPTNFTARFAIGLEESVTTEPTKLPIDRSVAGAALRTGATQVVGDVSQVPDIVLPHLAGKTLRSLVSVPLRSGAQTTGVLSCYFDQTNAFDEEAVHLLEAFGAVASASLTNASLYEQAERGREAAEREQQRLHELEQMKDEFLSTAAHELRTPLTSIRMSAGIVHEQLKLLAEQPGENGAPRLDPRLVDLAGLVLEGSLRMHSLVNDLLDLTRLEQGRASLAMQTIDMREVVKGCVGMTQALFDSKGQTLLVNMPESHFPVHGDADRLEQVLTNLLSNAHKYTPEGSITQVRVFRSSEECIVTVKDNGPGVPEGEHDLIFNRFFRSSMHRSDRTASTGLGLPIARKIAEMHKGRLTAEPAPGGGTVFTLALPMVGR
ncbi:MAG: two-component system, OmpR family, phosphate regulon sensor histidine kinase PhoR [Chloroflexia bacterium]|jgi:signal transduction histidine kinase|nr:two-component system, OmpR family, phosphate regulon sensor histidine kinase PhoR [Chloroflexia bacterium]